MKNEYLQLADNLSNYTVRLLGNIRGRDELEIVLNKTGKEGEEKYERLARLDLALKYKEKPVKKFSYFPMSLSVRRELTECCYLKSS
jgi:hypothetical protein